MNIKTVIGRIGIPVMAGALWLAGCAGGTGEGNPEFGSLSISLRAKADAPALSRRAVPGALSKTAANDTLRLLDEDSTAFLIDHIYAHADRIEIGRPAGAECRGSDTVECADSAVIVSGSRFVDLLEKPGPLVASGLELPPGVYNRMKIRFGRLADPGDGSVPPAYVPLVGHSVMMKGSFDYAGVSNRSLTIYLDFNEAFEFGNTSGLAIAADSLSNWAGVFLAGWWLRDLEITECLNEGKLVLGPDGGLVIDSGSECNEIEDSLGVNIKRSTRFEEDDEREAEHD